MTNCQKAIEGRRLRRIIFMNLILNLIILSFSFFVILLFARKGASHYTKALEQIKKENEFFTEMILGLESAGQNVCGPNLIKREIRIAIWELYNNLRVQPDRGNKNIVLHRKLLEKKLTIYSHLEEGKVNLEILPFLGILGTLMGFAVPYLADVAKATKLTFNVSGVAFFLAASTTIFALLGLIYLKKKYEAQTLSQFDYFRSQEESLEKIMVECDGYKILETWLRKWPDTISPDVPAPEKPLPQNDFLD